MAPDRKRQAQATARPKASWSPSPSGHDGSVGRPLRRLMGGAPEGRPSPGQRNDIERNGRCPCQRVGIARLGVAVGAHMTRSRKKGPKPPELFSLAIFSSHPISFSHLHLTQMSKASLLGCRQIHNGAKTLIATGWKFSHEMLLKADAPGRGAMNHTGTGGAGSSPRSTACRRPRVTAKPLTNRLP